MVQLRPFPLVFLSRQEPMYEWRLWHKYSNSGSDAKDEYLSFGRVGWVDPRVREGDGVPECFGVWESHRSVCSRTAFPA